MGWYHAEFQVSRCIALHLLRTTASASSPSLSGEAHLIAPISLLRVWQWLNYYEGDTLGRNDEGGV